MDLRDILQLHPDSVLLYWCYLRHILLWADTMPLPEAAKIRPALPVYLSARLVSGTYLSPQTKRAAGGEWGSPGVHVEPQPLTPASVRKVIQCARRFYVWAKITFPGEFRDVPIAWIETLRSPRLARGLDEHECVTLDGVGRLTHAKISAR